MQESNRDFLFRNKPQGITQGLSSDLGQKFQDRLKIAFETFKGWTQNANHVLATAKNISDTLLSSMQSVMAKSKNRMEIIEHFFSKIHVVLKAEASFKGNLQKFMFQKVTRVNSKRIVVENNQVIDLIENFEEEFEEVIAKFNQLEKKIKSTITCKTFKQRINPLQEKVAKQITSILGSKKAIENKMSSLNSEIESFEKKTFEKGKLAVKTEHSYYELFRGHFLAFSSVLHQVKEYSVMTLQLYDEVLALELLTMKSIKETFLVFMDAITDIFGSQTCQYFSLSRYLASNLNEVEVGGFSMDLTTMLQPVGIELILKKCKVETLTIDVLKLFYQSVELEEHTQTLDILVYSQFDGLVYHNEQAGIKCRIVATLDHFYLIFEEDPQREGWQLAHSFPFKSMNVCRTATTGYLNIKAKIKRLLWNSERQLHILFPFQISEDFLSFHSEVTGKKYQTAISTNRAWLMEPSNIFENRSEGLNNQVDTKDTNKSEDMDDGSVRSDEREGSGLARNYQTFFEDSDN